MVSFDQGTPGQSSSSLWTAAPGGGVCDHSVLIMEGSNVFVLGLSNIFFPPIPVGRLALAVPAVKPSLIERQGMALIKS